MKRSTSIERDHAFGQTMLTLRTAIGLTQAGLAGFLGVSGRAVGDWEAGASYPKAKHLKVLITLAVERKAFQAGREADEIRALWQAARQKSLLDEAWLAGLLMPQPVSTSQPVKETVDAISAAGGPRVDWGEALAVPSF